MSQYGESGMFRIFCTNYKGERKRKRERLTLKRFYVFMYVYVFSFADTLKLILTFTMDFNLCKSALNVL